MNRGYFRALLRDALINIHDYVELEKNSLNDLIPRADPNIPRAENLTRFIWESIQSLKPRGQPSQIGSLEWRYYLILSGRYIEGASIAEMQQRLGLGERQQRRLHARACTALEEIIWYRLFPASDASQLRREVGMMPPIEEAQLPDTEEISAEDFSFPISLEPLQLDKVIHETAAMFLPRLLGLGGDLFIQLSANLPRVQADRIILRQILLTVFNHILQHFTEGNVTINARPDKNMVVIVIQFLCKPSFIHFQDELGSHKLLAYWLERLSAQLQIDSIEGGGTLRELSKTPPQIRYVLELPQASQAKIVVMDDHEPAIRIIQRYINQRNIQVIGVSDPTLILSIVRTQKPKAIFLDVMMPGMDGWEILQKLKADPETLHVPVIICSVWEQPELAFSLGANGFLKKPISQAELLDELDHLNLLDISDE